MQQGDRHKYDALGPRDFRLLRLRWANLRRADLQGHLVTYRLLTEEDAASTYDTCVADQEHHNPRGLLLVDAGVYDALSYCWGTEDPLTHISIFEDGDIPSGIIPIKPNLENALRTFREQMGSHNEDHYFWVDALCIDQENDDEKSDQIQKIAHIYHMAQEVRVWLGPGSKMSDNAMNFLDKLKDLDDIDKLITDNKSNADWHSFRDLMRRDWFSRRWIIQEIALARNSRVYCGDKVVPWNLFMFAVSLFVEKAPELNKLFLESPEFYFHPDHLGEVETMSANTLVNVVTTLFRKNDSGEVVEHLLSLETLISSLTMFEASNPHDFVYAVLWLAADVTVGLKQGSKPPAALYKEVVHTPAHSPTSGAFPIPPVDTNVRLDFSDSLVDSPTSVLPPIGSADTQAHTSANRPFTGRSGGAKSSGGSNDKNNHLLKPSEAATRGRSRRNSMQLSSLREAEKHGGIPHLELNQIVVNYKKDILEVYKELIEFAVLRSKSLDIICRPWAPAVKDKPLPSWIRGLNERPFGLHPKEKVYRRVAADSLVGRPQWDQRIYHASGKMRAHIAVDKQTKKVIFDGALITYGFVLDTVAQVDDPATGGIVPASWLRMVDCEDTSKGLPERFWRTLVADRDSDGLRPPRAHFQRVCDWAFNMRRTPGYNLNTQEILREGKCPTVAEKVLRRVQAVIWDRRLVLTRGSEREDGSEKTSKLLALVPKLVEKGDLICILNGCSVPVVLREKRKEADVVRVTKRQAIAPPSRQGTLKKLRKSTTLKLPSDQSPTERLRYTSTASSDGRTGDTVDDTTPTPSPDPESAMSSSNTTQTNAPSSNSTPVEAPPTAKPEIVVSEARQTRFELIGECYVHGMMAGEAFKHRDDTGNPRQVFWLV